MAEDPLPLLALISYTLIGLAVLSLFVNLLHSKFSQVSSVLYMLSRLFFNRLPYSSMVIP